MGPEPGAWTSASACPACGAALPEGARFCPGCGARIEAAVSGPQSEGRHERRLLTVLFADVVAFTAASDGADPEDVRARVRPFHALVRREAARTGGTVARVMGDGVMVVWGYPLAREDDALRAVRAAVGVRDGLAGLPGDLHARLGINTGEAVVAFGAVDERADDAMGDAVNVAARLASAAAVDGVLIGETTARLAGDRLETDAPVMLQLKGKADPVPAHGVVRILLQRADDGPPFVGRDEDLGALLAAWRRAVAERRVVRVLVTGEPGIGKSRLLGELRRRLTDEGAISWHVGRCDPDSRSPAWALAELVRAHAGVVAEDSVDTVRVKLDAAVPSDLHDRGWLRDGLAQLLGLETATRMSHEELASAWARYLGLLAADTPAVVELEDLHWSDAELLAFVGGEALGAVTQPLLVVATGRPEVLDRVDGWAGIERRALAELADSACGELVGGLVATLQGDRRRSIVERAGGNPLFACELARLLAHGGTEDAAAPLPETVQSVIAARLDRMDPGVRAVARDAAVVGQRFWRGALVDLASIDPDRTTTIDGALERLASMDLVRVRRDSSLVGDVEYAFRHALVRDVAYGQLTRSDRARRHAATMRWLAGMADAERGDQAAAVADHGLTAIALGAGADAGPDASELRATTAAYLVRAGDHARWLDPATAAARYESAVELASDAPTRLRALAGVAYARFDLGEFDAALRPADGGIVIADELADSERRGQLLLLRLQALRRMGAPEWQEEAQRIVDDLRARAPTLALVDAYSLQAGFALAAGRGAEQIAWADQAIGLADAQGWPVPPLALARRGYARAIMGDEGGFDDLERALAVARAGGDETVHSECVSHAGGAAIAYGDLGRAASALRQSLELVRERGLRGHLAHRLCNLGYLARAMGNWGESEASFEAAIETAERMGDLRWLGNTLAEQYMLRVEQGDEAGADMIAASIATLQDVNAPIDEDLVAIITAIQGAKRRDRHGVEVVIAEITGPAADDDLYAAADDRLILGRALAAAGYRDLLETLAATTSIRTPLGGLIRIVLDGLAAEAAADLDRAAGLFSAAIERWQSWGWAPELAHAHEARARVLSAAGDADGAAAHRANADEIWRRIRVGDLAGDSVAAGR